MYDIRQTWGLQGHWRFSQVKWILRGVTGCCLERKSLWYSETLAGMVVTLVVAMIAFLLRVVVALGLD